MKDLAQLASLCNICLNSTNFSQKSLAQQKLQLFTSRLTPQSLPQLLLSLDQPSLFVLLSFLISQLPSTPSPSSYLPPLLSLYSQWFTSSSTFLIQNQPSSFHLHNKLKQYLGELIKTTYYTFLSDASFKQKMLKSFQKLTQQLRVFCYSSFIDAFSLMDYGMGFVGFRNFMNVFQVDWIEVMFEEVCRGLEGLEEGEEFERLIEGMERGMKIREDTVMRERGKGSKEKKGREADENNPTGFNFPKAESITELLKSLTEFKYNIDLKQFQQGYQYQDLIQFPKTITTLITDKLQPLSSSLTIRLLQQFPTHPLTLKFLNCYIRISSIPSFLPTSHIPLITTSTYLMSQHHLPLPIHHAILDLNWRIIKLICSFSRLFLCGENREVLGRWVEGMLENAEIVLRAAPVEFRNLQVDRVGKCFAGIFKGSSKGCMGEFAGGFALVAAQVFTKFATYLFTRNTCLLQDNVQDPQEMIAKSDDEFKKWVTTLFLAPTANFTTLRQHQLALFTAPTLALPNLINFNLFTTFIIKQCQSCFQENIHYQQIPQETTRVFGDIMMGCYEMYESLGVQIGGGAAATYHCTVLYFLSEFVKAIVGDIVVKKCQGKNGKDFMKMFFPEYAGGKEKIVLECIARIFKRLEVVDTGVVEFGLYILEGLARYVVGNYEGEEFVREVQGVMWREYVRIAAEVLVVERTIACRETLFRNVAGLITLGGNYCISHPLKQLFAVIETVKYPDAALSLPAQIYDIKGIAKGITRSYHLEEFIEILLPVLGALNQIVFSTTTSDKGLVEHTLSVYRYIFGASLHDNREESFEGSLNCVYEIVLPHWAAILNTYNQSVVTEKDVDVLSIIVTSFCDYFSGEMVNPYNSQDFAGLLNAILISILRSRPLIEKLHEEFEPVLQLFRFTTGAVQEAIFDLMSESETDIYFNFYLYISFYYLSSLRGMIQNVDDTSRYISPNNLITASTRNLYDFIHNRHSIISPHLTFSLPNRIQTNIRRFISGNPEKTNEICYEYWKLAYITYDKVEYKDVWGYVVQELKGLTGVFQGSKGYVLGRFKEEGYWGKGMEREMEYVYEGVRVKDMVKEKERDFGAGAEWEEEVTDRVFEGMVKGWVEAVRESQRQVMDDY